MPCASTLSRVAAALALFAACAGSVHAEAARLSVRASAGLLTIVAEAVPLKEVLDRIGQVANVRVRVGETGAPETEQLVTLALEGVTVEEALRRLLDGKDFVLLYGDDGVKEARVYPTPPRSAPPPPSATPQPSAPRGPESGRPADAAASPDASVPAPSTSPAELRRTALTDQDPQRRVQAVEALAGSIQQRETVDTVVEILQRDSHPTVLQRALDVIGRADSLPLDPVIQLALSNPDQEVRITALTRLAEHGGEPRARQMLELRATADPAGAVRDAAQQLLRKVSP